MKRRLLVAFSALALLVLGGRRGWALDFSVDALDVSYDVDQEAYTLTWDGIDNSTTNANVSYRIYFKFGSVSIDSNTATYIDTAFDEPLLVNPEYVFNPVVMSSNPYGTYSFRVYADDSSSGFVDTSPTTVSRFLNSFTRGDESGLQEGHGLHWDFTASQQSDANITVAIFDPFTASGVDANGFVTVPATSTARKVIMDNVPRSAAFNDYKLKFSWDSRSSSGTIVPNGIYMMYLAARDASGVLVDASTQSVPVDTLRILNLSATGISAAVSTGTINYETNGDMLMTILIAKPGTKFGYAASAGSLTYLSGAYTYSYVQHDPVPINSNGSVDGTNLLRVMRFYRENGAHEESWNGQDEDGVGVDAGIYAYSISGRDDYGNFAVKASGDDGPIADTIVVDQNAPSSGGTGGTGGVTNDVTAPVISAITPANGATVTSVLTGVSAAMSDESDGSGLNVTASSITVRDSTGALVPGATSFASGTMRLTFTNALTRADNGIYSIRAIAIDEAGNVSIPSTGTFTVNIEDPNVFANGVPIYAYPNPAKNASGVTVSFNTNRSVTMTFQIFNLLGEVLHEEKFSSGTGAQTVTWNLTNTDGEPVTSGLYIYRLAGEESGSTQEIVKKVVIVQ